ncbi:hypothetical protein GLN3_09145 [Geobacillus lituanicus]|nr:hypothetical protein GLN3_09145 [Geobacillus lituanicus]
MKTVVGLGDAAIVDLLAEIGSFAHYWNSRQLIKLADLTLKDHSSGQHKGQKQVSKRGRKRLCSILFWVMIPWFTTMRRFAHCMSMTRPGR